MVTTNQIRMSHGDRVTRALASIEGALVDPVSQADRRTIKETLRADAR